MTVPNVGPMEMFVIVLVLLLLFGPSRLAGVGAAAGKTIREFRKAMSDVEDELKGTKPPTHGA